MESKKKPSVSDAAVSVHIDEFGRQYVDPKELVAQRSVRETLEKIEERFRHARTQRTGAASNTEQ